MGEKRQYPVARLSQEAVERALDERNVSWDLLLAISQVTGLRDHDNDAARTFAEKAFIPAREIFIENQGGEVALFPPLGGIHLDGKGEFQWVFQTAELSFDWTEARPLTYEIEVMSEEAREWWPDEPPVEKQAILARVSRFFRKIAGSAGAPQVRRSHSQRAFGLAAWLMGSIKEENDRHLTDSESDSESLPQPSAKFKADLANYRNELAAAQSRLSEAIQRKVQSRYWQGAIIGICVVALISMLIGLVFWWRGTDAAYGVALPAGGLGALVSLLQRMSSGKLVLDINASRDLLELFGAVRPLIGAVFGMAVTALLIGGLVPVIQIPENQELAFFAGVGFLAGFNERWAQDMLKKSSDQVSR
jgi:hypothetical protein